MHQLADLLGRVRALGDDVGAVWIIFDNTAAGAATANALAMRDRLRRLVVSKPSAASWCQAGPRTARSGAGLVGRDNAYDEVEDQFELAIAVNGEGLSQRLAFRLVARAWSLRTRASTGRMRRLRRSRGFASRRR